MYYLINLFYGNENCFETYFFFIAIFKLGPIFILVDQYMINTIIDTVDQLIFDPKSKIIFTDAGKTLDQIY